MQPTIPTSLLRTFVAVVECRSYSRAAMIVGLTQPGVSIQIRRLQTMIGCDLLDKSAPGVRLTVQGETVLNYARTILSLNDEIVALYGDKAASPRLGTSAGRMSTGTKLARR